MVKSASRNSATIGASTTSSRAGPIRRNVGGWSGEDSGIGLSITAKNAYGFTRAAFSTGRRLKSKFLSILLARFDSKRMLPKLGSGAGGQPRLTQKWVLPSHEHPHESKHTSGSAGPDAPALRPCGPQIQIPTGQRTGRTLRLSSQGRSARF